MTSNLPYDKIPSKELVEELKKREGVEVIIVDPYENKEIKIEGPAIILLVKD